jgi:CII-binding regulator of phage lambda lysogenization HflD
MMKTLATNFKLNQQRIQLIDSITNEYLSMLAILYGDQIEMGTKRISDYRDMTMLEAENELRVRTMMMKGQRMRTKRKLREEHEAAEKALMEQLKKSQQPASQ